MLLQVLNEGDPDEIVWRSYSVLNCSEFIKTVLQTKLQCKCWQTDAYVLDSYELNIPEVTVFGGLLVWKDVYETSNTNKNNSAQLFG